LTKLGKYLYIFPFTKRYVIKHRTNPVPFSQKFPVCPHWRAFGHWTLNMRYPYFPTTFIVTLLYIMENGASTEVAVIGNEGMIGVALFMNGGTMPNRAIIVNGGYAYRLRIQLLMKEFDRLAGNELIMTQELIANMLGVRREGITEAASKLQRAG
jgi:hypothetical protein